MFGPLVHLSMHVSAVGDKTQTCDHVKIGGTVKSWIQDHWGGESRLDVDK